MKFHPIAFPRDPEIGTKQTVEQFYVAWYFRKEGIFYTVSKNYNVIIRKYSEMPSIPK